MSPNEIAKALEAGLLSSWQFWLMIVLNIVSLICTGILAIFFKRRETKQIDTAKLEVIDENIDKILNHVSQTTITTEKIKSDIGHDDWNSKEQRTILMKKLVELVDCSITIQTSIRALSELKATESTEHHRKLQETRAKCLSIKTIFFPELKDSILKMLQAANDFEMCLHELSIRYPKGGDTKSTEINRHDFERLQKHTTELNKTVDLFGVSAAAKFQSIYSRRILLSEDARNESTPN